MRRSEVFAETRPAMQDALGPLVDLTSIDFTEGDYATIPTILPPGMVVPMHSHAERELMLVVEGRLDAWLDGSWHRFGPGTFIEVAPDVRHALRNDTGDEVSMVLTTTARMGQFFAAIAAPQGTGMTAERLDAFAAVAAEYGFWNGSREEQAAIGIDIAYEPGSKP